jgi:hypothetical protein
VVNIRIDLAELGLGGVDCTGLAQQRDKWRVVMNAVYSGYTTGGLSSSAELHTVCSQHYVMKTYGGVEWVYRSVFLTSDLDEGDLSPVKTNPVVHWAAGWVESLSRSQRYEKSQHS